MAEKLPAGGVEIIAQGTAGTADEIRQQISLQALKVAILEDLVQAVEIGRLLDDHFLLGRDAQFLHGQVDVQVRPVLEDLVGRHRVVDRRHVAVLLASPGDLGHRILDSEVLGGQFFGILQTGKFEDLDKEVLVSGLELGVLRVEVVVTVAHAQAALAQVEDLHVAVHQVSVHAAAIETAFTDLVHAAQQAGQVLLGGNGLDLGNVRLDRLGTQLVAGQGVKGHLIEVGDFLVHGAFLGRHLRHLGKEVVELFLGVLADGIEGTVTGILGRKRMGFLPTAGGILIKILARAHGRIQGGQVEGRKFLLLLAAGACQHGSGHHHDHRFFHIENL